jgi:hypothetical protein
MLHARKRKVQWQFQIWVGILVVLGFWGFIETKGVFQNYGIEFSIKSSWACLLTVITLGSSLIGFVVLFLAIRPRRFWLHVTGLFDQPSQTLRWGSITIAVVCELLFFIISLNPNTSMIISGEMIRFLLYWWIASLGTLAVRAWKSTNWLTSLTMSASFILVLWQLATFVPRISAYPFSLGWSEASYLYYASLLASEKLYGMQLPLSTMYPSRNLLDAIPFVMGVSSIWVSRLWAVLLWVGFTATTSITLAWRLKISNRLAKWIFASLAFVYFLQGDLKYELQVCVIIVLLGTSPQHPWRTLLSLLCASLWAGMSRLNWYPVPGMLAGALYLLEVPLQKRESLFHYLRKPLLWFIVGTGAAFLGSSIVILLTQSTAWGLSLGFGTGIQSLWYRLFPNQTYPPGIIPGFILYSLPLLWILAGKINRISFASPQMIRWLGLSVYIFILLIGGLYVSTKIGGGGDLHNLDAYMVLLVIIASYIAFDRYMPNQPAPSGKHPYWISVVLAIPLLYSYVMKDILPIYRYDHSYLDRQLEILQSHVQQAASEGEILFIRERQLLTYGVIESIPLFPDYELVELQSRANLHEQIYFEQFYSDLESHRFSMIISQTLYDELQGNSSAWGEENNNWVLQVVRPILCEYEALTTIPGLSINNLNLTLYVPRDQTNCP